MRCSFARFVVRILVVLAPCASPALAQVELTPVEPGVADVSPLGASLRSLQADLRTPVGFDRVYGVAGRDDVWVRSSGALHAVFPRSWYEAGADGGMEALIPAGTTFRIGHDALEAALTVDPLGASMPGPLGAPLVGGARRAAVPWSAPIEARPQHAEPFARPIDALADRAATPSSPLSPPPSPATGERAGATRLVMAPSARDDVDATDDASVKGPPILVDVDYRQRRLLELMRRAAAAQAARGPSSS